MAQSLPKDPNVLAKVFANRSIDTNEIAFYNSPEFLKAEQRDNNMLSFYACHVEQLEFTEAQTKRNSRCIEQLCKALHKFLLGDIQVGTCVDLSGMLSKFLEAYGIWNYCVSGSMNFHNPALQVEGNTTYFWSIDMTPKPGHVWVVAPPFRIVDLSIKTQPYTANELDLLPSYILQKSLSKVEATTNDHVSPERRILHLGPVLSLQEKAYYKLDPNMKKFDEYFQGGEFKIQDTTFRYLSAGVLMTDAMSIGDLTGRKWNGKYPAQIFDEIIKPRMSEAGFEVI